MTNPLAALFDGSAEVEAELAARIADPVDHWALARRTVDAHHPRRLHLTVSEVLDETATTRTFRLRAPDGSDLPPFLAGQYVALYVDGTSRPYAISSSPARRDHYDLTVRRVPGGRVSNILLDTLAAGDIVTTSGPMGTFAHNPLFHGDDVVFLAGGSGVAPAMSMIGDIVDDGLDRRFHLVYGTRTADDVIFGDTLTRIAAEHPNVRVDLVVQEPDPGWSGRSGLIDAETIAALVGPLVGRMVYVCGPRAMYPHALRELAALGHPRRRIRFEANGAPSDPAAQASWPAGFDPHGEVTVTTRSASFTTRRDRPLLDALEDHGITVEAACRSGECSLCRCRVRSGTVHSADEAQLRMSDERSGYVHACVAYPMTDVELDV